MLEIARLRRGSGGTSFSVMAKYLCAAGARGARVDSCFMAGEVLLEVPPPAVKPHVKNILPWAQSPQEVGAKPMLLI